MIPHKIKRSLLPFGFTLVELIIVITILAILGTIGFLALGGYSSKARDSARVGDIATVSKSLDLSIVTAGSYPDPDSSFAVTYSGGVVWNQGKVGTNVINYLKSSISGGGINKKPVDPLSSQEYVYSSLAYGKAYQIKADYEGDVAVSLSPILDTAYAAAGDPTVAYIKGTYGGVTARTIVPNGTGSIVYVLAIPSIITSTGSVGIEKIEITSGDSLSGKLLFNGKPLKAASGFNPNQVVYSGGSLPSTDTEMENIVNKLKAVYENSDIRDSSSLAGLLSVTGSTTNLVAFGSSIVKNQLGGTSGVVSTDVGGNGNTITGDDTTGRNWSDGSYATSCNTYLNPTAPKVYSGVTGS